MNLKLLLSKSHLVVNILRKRPILTIFDVTKLCNQRCPMCNIWKERSSDMPLEEIQNHARALHKFGVGYVFLQGGEPLIRKDILEIVDVFLENGIRPTIISNGILLTQQLAEEIAKRQCNLAISIDSLDRKKYTMLRGRDTMDKVIDNIKAVAYLKGAHKGNWSITTTVTKKTELEDVRHLRKFAYENGFMYAIRPYIHVSGTAGKEDERLVYDYKDVLEIFDFIAKKAKKENFLAYLIYQEHIRYMEGNPMPECDALNYSFLLKENGKMAPCIEFPDTEVSLNEFTKRKKQCKSCLDICNSTTPCFYNDAREIGFLVRKKWIILRHIPELVRQMKQYGNFF